MNTFTLCSFSVLALDEIFFLFLLLESGIAWAMMRRNPPIMSIAIVIIVIIIEIMIIYQYIGMSKRLAHAPEATVPFLTRRGGKSDMAQTGSTISVTIQRGR